MILQAIKDWLTDVCQLVNPPDWLGGFIDVASVTLLCVCIAMLCLLAYVVLRAVFTFWR